MSRDDEYIALLREKLGDYRFVHSLNVAKSARMLALRYGGDPEKSYTAGLLHDIMKDSEPNIQLQVIQKDGIILNQYEMYNRKLWHAISGAAFIKCELGITDADFLNSVRYHTTGRRGMSLLEKIIYIADYISDERVYDGVEKMRALAEKSLEDAMSFGLEFTISDLAAKGQIIHPDSVECYNELVIKKINSRKEDK